ncbi:MAG TPA: hypothetical protein VLF63_00445 [Patescibacteria group bacterium]|nr:hypothetical protein [Patescibacteria group bacterium]
MNRTRYTARNQNSVKFNTRVGTLGPVSNTISLIILACLLGLLYLTQVTKTNAFGYQINNLEQTQSSLKSRYNNLEVDSARLQSFSRVENSPVAKTLTPVAPSDTVTH